MSESLTREQVQKFLEQEGYDNLAAVMQGCVSGWYSEWPMVRLELAKLVITLRAKLEEAQADKLTMYEEAEHVAGEALKRFNVLEQQLQLFPTQ